MILAPEARPTAARFEAFPPDRGSLSRILEPGHGYRVGRHADCELHIDHPSISRFHAHLCDDAQGWRLDDTASKNGLRVDGRLTTQALFVDAAWFAVGDVYCQFTPLSPAQVSQLRAHGDTQRSISRALASRLVPDLGIDGLLAQALDAILELSGLQRGFVLFGEEPQALRVRCQRGLDPRELLRATFAGSAGAVDRVLRERRSVVCGDTANTPWLGARPSVELGGIRALICVPLLLGAEVLGAIYADSCRSAAPLTELDQELIESLADQTASTLATARLRSAVEQLVEAGQAAGAQAPTWDEIRAACVHA